MVTTGAFGKSSRFCRPIKKKGPAPPPALKLVAAFTASPHYSASLVLDSYEMAIVVQPWQYRLMSALYRLNPVGILALIVVS